LPQRSFCLDRGRRPVHQGGDRLRPARPRRTQTTQQRLGLAATSSAWSAKDSATTISPQGFSSHRTPCKPTSPHVYTKLGLTSRVQLAQEAARHTW